MLIKVRSGAKKIALRENYFLNCGYVNFGQMGSISLALLAIFVPIKVNGRYDSAIAAEITVGGDDPARIKTGAKLGRPSKPKSTYGRSASVPIAQAAKSETVTVRGSNVSMVRASSLYGFTLKGQPPRTASHVSSEAFKNDIIDTVDQFARYAPGVARGSAGGVQQAPIIRGQQGQLYVDGFQQGSAGFETIPLSTNAYDGADIVSGPASVIFGPTSDTSGYINYTTKKPYFDKLHGSYTQTLGSLYWGKGGVKNFQEQIDLGGPLNGNHDIGFRFSYERRDTQTYYGGKNNHDDFYGAISFHPTEGVQIDWNAQYVRYDYNEDFGWNRVTSDLVNNNNYLGGTAIPVIAGGGSPTGFYSPVLGSNGQFTGSFVTRVPSSLTSGRVSGLGTFVGGAAFVPQGTGSVYGYVLNPTSATHLSSSTSLTNPHNIYSADVFRTSLRESYGRESSVKIVNTTTYERATDTKLDYTGFSRDYYANYMENRTEFLLGRHFTLFGTPVDYKTDSGIDERFEWVNGGPNSTSNYGASVFDLTTGNSQYLNTVTGNQFPAITANGLVYNDLLYGKGVGISFQKTVVTSNGIPVNPSKQSVTNDAQVAGFTQHEFDFGEHWTALVGGRLTYFRANAALPYLGEASSGNYLEPSYNASLTYRPISRISFYVSYVYTQAVTTVDGVAGAFALNSAGALNSKDFHSPARLLEGGVKINIIPGQLNLDLTGFRQKRVVVSSYDLSNSIEKAHGFDVSLRYHVPHSSISVGLNYEYLDAQQYLHPLFFAVFSPYGVKADGQTLFNSIAANLGIASGWYPVATVPKHNLSLNVDWRIVGGFGVTGDIWFNSPWYDNYLQTVKIPSSYRINMGFYYDDGKNWHAQIQLQNLTNTKSYSTVIGSSGDNILQLPPFTAQARVSYRF